MQSVDLFSRQPATEDSFDFTHCGPETVDSPLYFSPRRTALQNAASGQRAQLPESRYSLWHQRKHDVDIFRCVLLAQAEADAGSRPIGAKPHCHEYVRWLNRARRTRGAR